MDKVIDENRCCGCELCVEVCPKNAIKMVKDKKQAGFTYPVIDKERCIGCELCRRNCIVENISYSSMGNPIKCVGGYVIDKEKIKVSSSGGYWISIAEGFKKKYPDSYIVGVIYDNNYCGTTYMMSNDWKDIFKMVGTKYAQAQKDGILKKIREELQKGNKVLMTGLPCEIVAAKAMVGNKLEDNFYTVDLICQGPTSNAALEEYSRYLEKRFSSQIKYLTMREKLGNEWIPQWMHVVFENGKEYKEPFYFTALGSFFHNVQRKSCRECEFIQNRKADITIGDFHGAKKKGSYYNAKGTSGALVWTEKGIELISLMKENCVCNEISTDEFMLPNPRSYQSICWSDDKLYEKYKRNYALFGLIVSDWLYRPAKDKLLKILPYKLRTFYRKKKEFFRNGK